jgi:hypothetical protein
LGIGDEFEGGWDYRPEVQSVVEEVSNMIEELAGRILAEIKNQSFSFCAIKPPILARIVP